MGPSLPAEIVELTLWQEISLAMDHVYVSSNADNVESRYLNLSSSRMFYARYDCSTIAL